MSEIVIAGNTSGSVTIAAPDVAGTTTLTLPASSGTVLDDASVGVCRAWVNFNGTGTVAIRAAFNVSSITDNGTGDYTVNFTTSMPDVNYSAVIGWRVFSSANIRAGGFNNYTTSSVDVYGGYMTSSSAFTAEDATFVSVAIFR